MRDFYVPTLLCSSKTILLLMPPLLFGSWVEFIMEYQVRKRKDFNLSKARLGKKLQFVNTVSDIIVSSTLSLPLSPLLQYVNVSQSTINIAYICCLNFVSTTIFPFLLFTAVWNMTPEGNFTGRNKRGIKLKQFTHISGVPRFFSSVCAFSCYAQSFP